MKASYFEMYGAYLINWGEYEKGRKLTDLALQLAQQHGFDEIALHCLEDIAHHYLQTDQSQELEQCSKKVMELATKIKKENHLGLAFRLLGMAQLIARRYKKAEETFLKSIKIFEDLEMESKFYTLNKLAPRCYIGEMRQWSGETDYALEQFEYCLNSCKKAGLFWGQSHFHAHAADAALDMEEWDLVRHHTSSGVSLFESSRGGHCSALLYSLQAICDAKSGDLENAVTSLKKADFLAAIGKRSWNAAQMMAKAWIARAGDIEPGGLINKSSKEYATASLVMYQAMGAHKRADYVKREFL